MLVVKGEVDPDVWEPRRLHFRLQVDGRHLAFDFFDVAVATYDREGITTLHGYPTAPRPRR
ncbi:hypothetical protein I6F15_25470 [Bradyrhizobium sp. BRP14]|nr:hypothetical protein [Bradyrhizobium sp. BRP14]